MPRARLPLRFTAALALATLSTAGCFDPPDVELDPTPDPTLVSSGDYRFTAVSVLPPEQGVDLDSEAGADNNFPYLLDQLYAALEEAVLMVLEQQDLDGLSPEQVWSLLTGVLATAGVPVNTTAYNQALDDAVRAATVNYLPYVTSEGGSVSVVFYTGIATPTGYVRDADSETNPDLGAIGSWTGAGVPDVLVTGGDLLLLYTQPWFNLELREVRGGFHWTGEALSDGLIGGGIPLADVVAAMVSLVPASIEVNGQTVDLPIELLSQMLEQLLETSVVATTGEPLFDLELESGETAISAGLSFSGARAQVVR